MNISPLVFVAVAVAICAGACGSASGGMGVAFNALKDTFVSMGVAPEYIHRVGAIAAGTLDTLPHQGAQITLLGICKLSNNADFNTCNYIVCIHSACFNGSLRNILKRHLKRLTMR